MPNVTIKNNGKAAYVVPDAEGGSDVVIVPGAKEPANVSDYVMGLIAETATLDVEKRGPGRPPKDAE